MIGPDTRKEERGRQVGMNVLDLVGNHLGGLQTGKSTLWVRLVSRFLFLLERSRQGRVRKGGVGGCSLRGFDAPQSVVVAKVEECRRTSNGEKKLSSCLNK